MGKDCSCVCSICSVCCMVCSLFIVIPSCVIFVITTDKILYVGSAWNSSSISDSGSPQLIPFDPYSCPKDKNFYSQPFLLFLEVNAPESTGLILTLRDRNIPNSKKLESCSVNADGFCRIPVPRLDKVFAFISLDYSGSSTETVEWRCSYYNLPYLLSLIFLSCCACLCLACCCNTCLCCTKYCCCDSANHHITQEERHVLTEDPKPQRRYQHQVTRRAVPGTQPLFVGKRIETVVEDGVAVRREITTLRMVTESGKFQVIENVKVIATDGTNTVVAEATHGLKLN